MKRATTILIFCVALLVGLGMVTLYSSSMNMELAARKTKDAGAAANSAGDDAVNKIAEPHRVAVGANFLRQQLAWGAFGLVGLVAAAMVDYRRWKRIAPWLMGLAAILLVLVFVPNVGYSAGGARRWIAVPHLHLPHFQPSELAKLALIFFLAAYGERFQRHMGTFKHGVLIPGALTAVILVLVFIEPDRGCTILLAAVAGAMLIIAGVRLVYLIPPVIGAAGLVALTLLHDTMRLNRILAWLHPELNKDGAGYQAYQALIALGSGGWFGLGLGNGRQKLGFVPEHHTDFIFSIIGEELGLVTTLAVVLIFIVLVACGIFISRRACDTFGMLLGAGITFMIGIQAFINMGVVTSLLPNKGMPLPFISYGGSNLLLMLISVGLLLSISRFAAEPIVAKANPANPANPFEPSPNLTHE